MNSSVEPERWRSVPHSILITGGVVSIVGIILNVCHLTVLHYMPVIQQLGANNSRFLLKAVAVVDICLMSLKLPLENRQVQQSLAQWQGLCAFTAVLGYSCLYAAQMMMAVGIVDKLLLIAKTSSYSNSSHTRLFKLVVWLPLLWFLVWFLALVMVHHDTILTPRGFCICYLDVSRLQLLSVFITVSALLAPTATLLMYIAMVNILWRSDRRQQPDGQKLQTLRAARYILIILLTQLICWIPPAINASLHSNMGVYIIELFYMAPTLASVGSLIRPILYGMMNSSYRSYLRKRLCVRQEVQPVNLEARMVVREIMLGIDRPLSTIS